MRTHLGAWLCAAVGLLPLAGCGAEYKSPVFPAASAPARAPAEAQRGASQEQGEGKALQAAPRKIIYNAQVDLVVESVSATEKDLLELVKSNGGYLSETEMNSHPRSPRSATWKVRVPVDTFDTFLASVTRLGELTRNHLDSQDVTQEYYDLEARIANKQQEEKRLLKHLADSTGKLEDILAVEKELSRVRGEIEQGQGRLRYLTNQTALSTITINATEVQGYKPPVSPTFVTTIGRTFHESLSALLSFGKTLVLVAVALVPWVPVIAIVAVPFLWLARRRRTRAA
jgi:hypothetical protein